MAGKKKSTFIAYLLWFFLGGFGCHAFYIGRPAYGCFLLIWNTLAFIATIVFPPAAAMFFVSGFCLFIDLFALPGQIRHGYDKEKRRLIKELSDAG